MAHRVYQSDNIQCTGIVLRAMSKTMNSATLGSISSLVPSDPDTRAQTHPRDFPSPCYGVGEAFLGPSCVLRQVCGHSVTRWPGLSFGQWLAGIFRPLHLPFHLLVKMVFIKRFPATSSGTAAFGTISLNQCDAAGSAHRSQTFPCICHNR